MKRRLVHGLILSALALGASGCGEDPKPLHVEGSYSLGCTEGCSEREFNIRGDHGEANETDINRLWADIYLVCSVDEFSAGVEGVTAFVSDQPLGSDNDGGRTGFEIKRGVVTGGAVESYYVVVWDGGFDFIVDTEELMIAGQGNADEDQVACDRLDIDIRSDKAFDVTFDCLDMRTTFSGQSPRKAELGFISFSGCQ